MNYKNNFEFGNISKNVKVFEGIDHLFDAITQKLMVLNNKAIKTNRNLFVALSGGNTPKLFYKYLLNQNDSKIVWQNIHFFWSDERCVPFNDVESNSGEAFRIFFSKLEIPRKNVHFVNCQKDPVISANQYQMEIKSKLPSRNNFPVFDIIFLGLGEDGHTASIFPGQSSIIKSDKICEISLQPKTKQKRITFTLNVINNSKNVFFLVTGKKKADILSKILIEKESDYPAAMVSPTEGELIWFVSKEANINFR